MSGLWQDVRFAIRLFRQRPGFTATAVLTLALGIGVNVAVFSVLDGVLLQWLPFPQPERIVRVAETEGDMNDQPFNPANFEDLRRATGDVFAGLAAFRPGANTTLTGIGDAVAVQTQLTTPELFDVMAVAPALGRPLTRDDMTLTARAVVISHEFWNARLGGDPSAVGRAIDLDGVSWTIVGIMPKARAYPAGTEIWLPLQLEPEVWAARNSWFLQSVGRLRPGVTIEHANAAVDQAMRSTPAAGKRSAEVKDLRAWSVARIRPDLLFAQGVSALVLLIACANLANLLLASNSRRGHEIGIRSSLGAARSRLVRQLLAESLVLSVAGGALGVAFAWWLVPALIDAYPGYLPGRERIGMNVAEMGVALAASTLTAILCGLAPAITGSRSNLSAWLRASSRSTPGRWTQRVRSSLVAVEVMLTLALLAGAVLLTRSFAGLTGQTIGFDAGNILTAQVAAPAGRYPTPAARNLFFDNALDEVRARPDVAAAALSFPMPFDRASIGMGFRNPDGGPQIYSSMQYVTADYAKVFGIPVVRGRFINGSDVAGAEPVAVANQAFVEKFSKAGDVLGMRLASANGWITIVGIVPDVRVNYFQNPKPTLLVPIPQSQVTSAKFAIRTRGDALAFAPALREIVRRLDPKMPLTAQATVTELMGKSVADRRFNMALLGGLASLALLLAVIGIYGVVSFAVGQRTREIGIRMALGAYSARVQLMIVGQGLVPIVTGIAAGVCGAWFLTTLLKKELFGIQPHDPSTFVVSAAVFLLVGTLACWIPARRAARVSPVDVLRRD